MCKNIIMSTFVRIKKVLSCNTHCEDLLPATGFRIAAVMWMYSFNLLKQGTLGGKKGEVKVVSAELQNAYFTLNPYLFEDYCVGSSQRLFPLPNRSRRQRTINVQKGSIQCVKQVHQSTPCIPLRTEDSLRLSTVEQWRLFRIAFTVRNYVVLCL